MDHWRSSIPYTTERIHAAAVYCSDGRLGGAFDEFLQNGLGLPRYDRLAVPGGPACLAGHLSTHREEEGLVEELRFLIHIHKIERVVLIAHQNCAYYRERLFIGPEELEPRQSTDLAAAARRIADYGPHLEIEAHFAYVEGERIAFRPVDLPTWEGKSATSRTPAAS